MGIALTDILIELADPRRNAEFQRDPEAYLADLQTGANELTAEDKEALLSRDIRKIRKRARSSKAAGPAEQFNRSANFEGSNELVVVDPPTDVDIPLEHPDPEIHVEPPPTENEAIRARAGMFVDANGTFYRAVRAEQA